MAKKEILSKFNLKDYNNELEKILEGKDFSSQVKNLLLSMFYKLEIGYKDYAIVKQDINSKEAIMESILNVIKTKCKNIELTKPNLDEQKESEACYIVYPEEGKIVCYQNESALLQAILEMGTKEFFVSKNDLPFKRAVQKVLIQGYELNLKELLINFDGWAWNNNFDKYDNVSSFLLYQNLRLLFGNTFLYDWKRDRRRNRDYLSEIKNFSEDFWKIFCKYCLQCISMEKNEKLGIEHELDTLKQELKDMKDKVNFLKKMYEQKKITSESIKRIDKILNDNELLKGEFLTRNSDLPEKDKIFSLSDLEEIIQNERVACVDKLQECNYILEPKNYLNKIKKIEQQIEMIEDANIKQVDSNIIQQKQIDLQFIFLNEFKKKLDNAVTKKELIELVYHYRYYLWLPIQTNTGLKRIREVPELQEEIIEVAKKVITKACKLKALLIINQDIQYNFEIMFKIIDTKIIHLEEICAIFSKSDDMINVDIYEGEILDRVESIPKEKEEDFMIKFNKKIRIFT